MIVNNKTLIFTALFLIMVSCAPKQQVVFKSVKNLLVDGGMGGTPVLKGEAIFFNPNKLQTRLKEIKVEVLVDGKRAAEVDQTMDLLIPGKSEFTVMPLLGFLEVKPIKFNLWVISV
jgi:hypothetical protein